MKINKESSRGIVKQHSQRSASTRKANVKPPVYEIDGYRIKGFFTPNGDSEYGIIKDPYGNKLKGKFRNMKIVEGIKTFSVNGVIQSIYEGLFQDGKAKEGRFCNEKEFYAGKFENGFLHEGVLIRNDVICMGKFEDGLIKNGEVQHSNGTFEKGVFVGGRLKEGIAAYSNGIVHEGQFDNNGLEKGTYYSNGVVFQGRFENGVAAEGMYSYKDIIWEGKFDKGKLLKGEIYRKDGKDFVSTKSDNIMERGRFEGTAFKTTTIIESGVIFTGTFDQDKQFESGTITFPDKTVMEGNFYKGVLVNGVVLEPGPEVYVAKNGYVAVLNTIVEDCQSIFSWWDLQPNWE